ncbi:metallophosphoesterase [Vampirovibrio chlorellavorus]|uniref:metallophosphoesterase n=1 Tax=Vampirovibrio chlorellavorus TaxID=758823 RepID=UPI0026ECCF5E|nr:metallophosphoesterase [Vampirovibrio chlorellavorus]
MPSSISSSSPKSTRTKRIWGLLALSLALLLGVLFWAFWFEDFDFYRPQTPLLCSEAPAQERPLRFIAFGDFGQGTPFQARLADEMVRLSHRKPYGLTLLLGDNIYPNGDINRLAKSHFEDPYSGLIAQKMRFLAAIGDHDDRKGHREDEMAYFKMPGDYYKVSEGPVDFFILNTTYFVRNPAQRAWIAKALAESKAPWKVVVGHHPLYSSGRNGNTEGTRAILEPLLVKYNVDLYLAGHDHDYERFAPIQGVRYIVSGGGGSYLYNFKQIQPYSEVRLKTHHFLFLEVTPKHIWVKAINRHGDVIDCLDWEKQRAGTDAKPPTESVL